MKLFSMLLIGCIALLFASAAAAVPIFEPSLIPLTVDIGGFVSLAAGAVISNNSGRLGKELWSEGEEGDKLSVRGLWDGPAEARWVAAIPTGCKCSRASS